MMKQVLRNIGRTICHEKMIFLVMCVCIFTSSVILNFAYGLYRNYDQEKYEADLDLQEIEVEIDPDMILRKSDLQRYVESLSSETLNAISIWFIAGHLEYFEGSNYPWLDCRFVYRDGNYTIPDEFREKKEKFQYSGRFISNEEESQGAYVTVVANTDGNGWNHYTEDLRVGENEIEMFGKTYEVIGETRQGAVTPIIPFLTVPDDFVFDDIMILDLEQTVI